MTINVNCCVGISVVFFLIAFWIAAGLVWIPQTEGRAVHLDLISIYTDPLIIYTYIALTPFFVALYQAFANEVSRMSILINDCRIYYFNTIIDRELVKQNTGKRLSVNF
jgi:hypothetical protein